METTHTVLVSVASQRAFTVFVDQLGQWWPKEYTWSSAGLAEIGMEGRADGKCYEIGPHGFRYDWGRILTYVPPERLEFTWQIGPNRVPEPDPEKSSVVNVTFREGDSDNTTLVTLVHDRFERHGDAGDVYCEGMASDAGWPYMLGRYADLVQTE